MPVIPKLLVEPNTPLQIALKFPEGKPVQGRYGDQVYFTLSHPSATGLYLDPGPAQKVAALGARPGEPFWICKRWTGNKKDTPVWEVWTDAGEPAEPTPPTRTAISPEAESVLEAHLRASLAEIERNKRGAGAAVASAAPVVAAAPVPSPAQQTMQRNSNPNGNGNGSAPNGKNGAAPYVAPSAGGSPLVKIPMDVAFGEVLDFMAAELRARNEQWTDQARQDFVSTILISAQKEGWVSIWRRPRPEAKVPGGVQ
jgi:hypothetical protein